MQPKALLTPKELALAIGTSESSLRRWVDAGNIRIARTAGGHRRIPLAEAVRFIRQTGAPVVRPEILGLGEMSLATPGAQDTEMLFVALKEGRREVARGLIVSEYLSGRSLPEIFDGPVAGAMHRLGELWKHSERGILIEHRATEICLESVVALRDLLPVAPDTAPLALGGAPAGDLYVLPSLMVAAVFSSCGFREINFGPNTPVELLAREAIERKARAMWISISAPTDVERLQSLLASAAGDLRKHGITLLVGGRHYLQCAPRRRDNVKALASMRELAEFAAKSANSP